MRVARAVGIAAAALFCQCTLLQAECITPPPPCEALKQASVVALVNVVDGGHREEELRPGQYVLRTDARLHVLEPFKGIPPDQIELSIRFPFLAESAWLTKGKTYLVYASGNTDGEWWTNCSRTRVVDANDDEVRVLRQCK